MENSMQWKTDKWYTSPWNFSKEARAGVNFADKIEFHDVSLRDGEQQSGLIFNKDQKIALAEKLAEVGIQRIEAGMPAVSEQDEAAIREIVRRNLGPKIFAFARCMRNDIKRALDCGVKNIVMEVPTSDHLLKYAYKWTAQKAIDLSIDATLYARDNGMYVSFFTIDGTRTDIDEYLDLIGKIASEGHMDELTIVDTMGGLNPHAIPFLVKRVKERIPDKPIGIHFHDDYGLASANTIIGLAAGANVAHTTISGIGERAGNAAYEDIAMALLTMYGVDTGLDYGKIYSLSKYLRNISSLHVRQNRGIIGDDLADVESGIVAGWFKNASKAAPLELSPYLYSLTGHPESKVTIGKMSGIPTVDIYLDELGLEVEGKDQKTEIVNMVKKKAFEVGRLLDLREFEEIAHKVIDR